MYKNVSMSRVRNFTPEAVKMHLCGMSVLIIVHVLRLTSSIELHIHRFI